MKSVTFVTRNPGKLHSLRRDLLVNGIEVEHHQANLEEIQADHTRIIAAQKAIDGFALTGESTIALDAGFNIPQLGDFPGPYIEYVLRKLQPEGIIALCPRSSQTSCHFIESLAYYDGQGEPKVFDEIIPGRLSPEPRGTLRPAHWSSLALVFVPEGWDITIAEMSDQQAEQWRSQRKSADNNIESFSRWYLN